MKHLTGFVFLLGITLSFSGVVVAQGVTPTCHSFTSGTSGSSYSQNFDTLASTGTSSVVPAGFGFAETGTSAAVDGLYAAGTGSSNVGNTYSFGSTSSSDRAFGGLRTDTLDPTIGACFTNNTGAPITSFAITYFGEMWRLGAITGRLDRLDFQYSLNAESLTSGTWVDVDSLDFETPNTADTGVTNRDGNLAANRTEKSGIITATIANGASWYIRYLDVNVTGSDDGLAIDNFSMSVGASPTSAPVSVSGRVLTAEGRTITGARLTIEGGNLTSPISAMTNPFGYFRFEGLSAGETYIVTIGSKQYAFAQPVRAITPKDNITDLDFVALP